MRIHLNPLITDRLIISIASWLIAVVLECKPLKLERDVLFYLLLFSKKIISDSDVFLQLNLKVIHFLLNLGYLIYT
jgi:hypothetical protein